MCSEVLVQDPLSSSDAIFNITHQEQNHKHTTIERDHMLRMELPLQQESN